MVNRAAGCDDVDARREQPAQLVETERVRHVEHTVRCEFDDLIDAGSGRYPGRCPAAQFTGIAARLVVSVYIDTGEGHVRVFDDGAQRAGADRPGGPLHHSVFASRAFVSRAGRQRFYLHRRPQLANRSKASWAYEATSVPFSVRMSPRPKLRPCASSGLCCLSSNHVSVRNGR